MTQHLHLGQLIPFDGNPFIEGLSVAKHVSSGAILVENGMIAQTGQAADLIEAYPNALHHDHGTGLILPGFVDAHAHYPQTGIIASWGKRLIDWLNTYTFPEESRFHDLAYARQIAELYLDLILSHGTTTVCTYCTIHPASVEAIFAAAEARGMRLLAGKTCMDRNAPDNLRDTAQSAYDDSKSLLERWHGRGRLDYVITPRFSPTSTPGQLSALGALWAEHPDCLMQTHLSEQTDEVAWVAGLFPQSRDYLDTYEQHGLLGPRGLYGHAIHLTDRERDRLRHTGAALVHCPTSNTFIGSGLFDLPGLTGENQRIGLATDTGGGSSFSMLRSMAAAYEIAQLKGKALHPAELIWLATEGSARALHLDQHIGALRAGQDADFIVIDLASSPAIAQRAHRAEDIWEALFPTIMMGDDRAIVQVYLAGRPAKPPQA